MNKESCGLRRVDKSKSEIDGLDPGDFYLFSDSSGQKWFATCLPGGTNCCIPLRPLLDSKTNNGHSWQWDGNEDEPTLTPSINCVGVWHGWVTKGKLVSCG